VLFLLEIILKIIINATNITEDRPLREADRLITMGLAHLPEVKPVPVKTYNGYVQSEQPEITFEDLNDIAIFSEPVTEVDVIEPIPVDKYVDFDEPKKAKKKQFWNK